MRGRAILMCRGPSRVQYDSHPSWLSNIRDAIKPSCLLPRKSANQVNRVWKITSCGRMMRLRSRVLLFEGEPMLDDQTYEVFKKSADNTTVAVETVKGLEEGRTVLAALRNDKSDDEYYLFDPISGNVIDPEQPYSSIDPLAS
jgi:hypothetical protein